MAEEVFASISVDDWKNSCEHVMKIERDYYQRGKTLYSDIDKIVINLQDDSSSSDEDMEEELSGVEHLDEDMDEEPTGVEYLDEDMLDSD